jgi:dTDP-4-dehydrorhamnose reductase
MLGQMVKEYFTAKGYEVNCFDQRFGYEGRLEYGSFLKTIRSGYVINCIGRIRQKTDNAGDLLNANTILPAELRNILHPDIALIHPSTDCIFSGKMGSPYPSGYESDAEDDYGWSKQLGEVVLHGRPNTLVVRVSIIGPDKNPQGKGLLAWVKSNPPGSTIKGYTNHLWNGITTLEWCNQVYEFIKKGSGFPFSMLQLGTKEDYSKYEMLLLFNKIFNLGLTIEPLATPGAVDRRLVPDLICKPLTEQLQDLK